MRLDTLAWFKAPCCRPSDLLKVTDSSASLVRLLWPLACIAAMGAYCASSVRILDALDLPIDLNQLFSFTSCLLFTFFSL